MAIKLKTNSGDVDLTTHVQTAKGDDGGYYIPAVDIDGNLTWTPSEEGMTPVISANIKGPQGEPGPQGQPGEKGEPGEKGADGAIRFEELTEEQIEALKGEPGPQGEPGAPFTYDMFTEAQLKALTGPQGPQGPKGDKGETGEQGPQGPKGADGTMTFEELTEEQKASLKGDKGDPGPVGTTGAAALVYSDGTGIISDEGAPTETVQNRSHHVTHFNRVPVVGEEFTVNYIDKNTEDVYVTARKIETIDNVNSFVTSSLLWSYKISGEDGVKGDKGDIGEKGEPGNDGYSPVRGVDYYTEEDKQEIINNVLASLPNGEEVNY